MSPVVRPHLLAILAVSACSPSANQSHPIPGDKRSAITVEVLNASGRPGDARVATRVLREAGIDVVYFGNAPGGGEGLDSTRIIVRRGSSAAAERVRAALGQGQISVALDSGRLLDVSVLLGADFAAATSTRGLGFHP